MAGPSWFLGIDAIFDVVFFVVTLLVAIVGYRGYRFFKDRKYLLLSQGFFFLAASYFMLMFTNYLTFAEAHDTDPIFQKMFEITHTIRIGFLLHAVLFLIGLILLVILYYHIEDWALRLLIAALVLFAFLMASSMTGGYYLLISLLLLALIVQLYRNWRKRHRLVSLLVFLGFLSVFVGEVLLTVLFLHESMYVASNFVTLGGYVAILVAQVRHEA